MPLTSKRQYLTIKFISRMNKGIDFISMNDRNKIETYLRWLLVKKGHSLKASIRCSETVMI